MLLLALKILGWCLVSLIGALLVALAVLAAVPYLNPDRDRPEGHV